MRTGEGCSSSQTPWTPLTTLLPIPWIGSDVHLQARRVGSDYGSRFDQRQPALMASHRAKEVVRIRVQILVIAPKQVPHPHSRIRSRGEVWCGRFGAAESAACAWIRQRGGLRLRLLHRPDRWQRACKHRGAILASCESLGMRSARPALASARVRSRCSATMLGVLAKHQTLHMPPVADFDCAVGLAGTEDTAAKVLPQEVRHVGLTAAPAPVSLLAATSWVPRVI
jgi:hypothetical protein